MSTSEAATVADPTCQQRGSRTAEQDSLQNEPSSNDKARRIAKAKAEVALLKLELAEARLALIELESSDGESTNVQSELMSVAKLPAFNGDHHDWVKFRDDYYESANRLTEAENMYRLRRSLHGKAKKEVKGCTDPEDVMETLKLRFSRDSLVKAEYERLKNLRLLSESQHELKLFATELETGARNLRQLNCLEYLYELPAMVIIGTLVRETLSNAMVDKWYKFLSGPPKREPDLPTFCSFVRKEADQTLNQRYGYY